MISNVPIMEKRVSLIRSSASELEEARAAYSETAEFLSTVPDEASRKAIFDSLRIINNRIQELEAAVHTEDGTQWVDTGVTFGERWDELDTEGRRLMLTSAGIKFRARTLKKGTRWYAPILETRLIVPEELRLAARTKAINVEEELARQRRGWWDSLDDRDRAALLEAGIGTDLLEEE